MKNLFSLVLVISFLASCTNNQSPVEDTPKPAAIVNEDTPQVALLGIFHFAGTTDYSSVEFDPLDSEKRQKEIREIIEKLKLFQPTKVLVEYPSNKAKKLDSLYAAYRSDAYTLTINEIDQIGFRLASELNHPHIHAIDYKLDLPFDQLIKFAETNEPEKFEQFLQSIKDQDQFESDYLAEHTLLEYLMLRNADAEDLRNKNQYINQTAQFVNDTTYIGVEFAAKWWERNLMMMANIDLVTETKDRILVIVGAAHRAILRDFFEDRTDVDYVEIRGYLEK